MGFVVLFVALAMAFLTLEGTLKTVSVISLSLSIYLSASLCLCQSLPFSLLQLHGCILHVVRCFWLSLSLLGAIPDVFLDFSLSLQFFLSLSLYLSLSSSFTVLL